MRRKLLLMTVSTIVVALFSIDVFAQGAPASSAGSSAGSADKINMVKRACANGALTKEECAAKMAALQAGASGRTGGSAPNNVPPQGNAYQHTFVQPNSPAGETPAGGAGSGAPAGSQVIMSNSPEFPGQSVPPLHQVDPGINDTHRLLEEQARKHFGQPTSYHDPQGRFSFTVPAGWKMEPQGRDGEDGVMISNGASWAMIGPYGGVEDTIDLVESLASQYQSEYQDYNMGDHGSMKVNGNDAAYAAFSGVNRNGEHVGMRYGGVSAGHGHFLGVAVFIPHDEIDSVDPQIKDLFMSISFGQ